MLTNVDIYGITCPAQLEMRSYIMRPLSILPKAQRKNYDVSGMGRYIRNILQWEENDIKSKKMNNGDYS